MDLKSTKASPIVTGSIPESKSRIGIRSSLLPYSQSAPPFSPRKKPGLLDDVRSNGWLDAMEASSPPRKKIVKDHFPDAASDDGDIAHRPWMPMLPSAINSFEKIVNNVGRKKIVMFLDYDGTLSPIVDDPDCAFMSDEMRSAVKNVAKYFPTAIISGRNRDKVYSLVGLTELYYAGSHGMDIMCPVDSANSADLSNCVISLDKQGKDVNLFQPAKEFLPMIDEVFRTLVENTRDIKGAKVENHKFCASIHYRNVDEKNWPTIAQCVHDILKGYPRLKLTHGRKVLEVRPIIDWNKGKAVEFLLESLGLSNSDDVLPFYIGDDKTDEDAFKVLRNGNLGYGILVCTAPKETKAFFELKDPTEVQKFLEALVNWKKMKCDGDHKEEDQY